MNTAFMKRSTADLVVIGGGAAGMMAAGTAAEAAPGRRVLLLEQGKKTGSKLLITGKGRCNVTNDCSVPDMLQNVPRNPRFLQSALYGFPPSAVMVFFQGLGVELKTERGNRVFPVSDQASEIVAALRGWIQAQGVTVQHARATGLAVEGNTLQGVLLEGGNLIEARAAILATGGCSYPGTGSDGSGYGLAEQAGHTIVPVEGSLVPLQEAGDWCAKLQGLSLRNVGVRLLDQKGKTVYTDFGELLFTHFGLSGPTVLSASAHMKAAERHTLSIDLKPALDEPTLDRRLLREFDSQKNKNLENVLTSLYPRKLIPVMLARSGVPGDTKVHTITKAQRRTLLDLTKSFCIEIAGKRPVEEAIVTSGGVDVRQVDPKTMASKRCAGLYFAGEILDVDAYTGGFNLQIAWATGRAAGRAAAGMI